MITEEKLQAIKEFYEEGKTENWTTSSGLNYCLELTRDKKYDRPIGLTLIWNPEVPDCVRIFTLNFNFIGLVKSISTYYQTSHSKVQDGTLRITTSEDIEIAIPFDFSKNERPFDVPIKKWGSE